MGVGRSVGIGLVVCAVLTGCQEMNFQSPFRELTPEEQAANPNVPKPPSGSAPVAADATRAPPPTEPSPAPTAGGERAAAPAPRSAAGATGAPAGGSPAPAPPAAPAEAPSAALVPLPRDLVLMPPAAGAPAGLVPFWGIWRGDWDGGIPHVLVVEMIESNAARAVVAWGDAPAWNVEKGWERHTARFADGVLTVRTDRPGTIVYRMRDPRTVEARYEWDGGSATATLVQ